MLQLPAELKLMIVRQLSREDLFSLFFVCKELKSFIHPLFYEHLLYTRMGFAFPHAPNAYPFLDIPNLHVRDPISAEERGDIMKRVRSITIPKHHHGKCGRWHEFQAKRRLAANADFISIELANPTSDGIAQCHEPVWPPACDLCEDDLDHDCHDEECGHPYPDCSFMDSLGKSTAETIVIKNYPILLNGVKDSFLSKQIPSASRFVFLLEPHTLDPEFDDMYDSFDDHDNEACPWGNRGLERLLDMIPSSAKDVTLVFKTNDPTAEWAPDCKHYDGHWYDGGYPHCSCCYDSDDWDVGAERKRKKQHSCWQSSFWRELAKGVAASKARFTLVNYSSIIPDGVERDKALRALKSGKRATVRKKLTLELRKAHKSEEEHEMRLADVRFASMENWIRSGAWENIFERRQLNIWFEHIAKKRKAKKAAAKETARPASAPEGKEDAISETVVKEQPKPVPALEEKEEAAVESAAPPKSTDSAAA